MLGVTTPTPPPPATELTPENEQDDEGLRLRQMLSETKAERDVANDIIRQLKPDLNSKIRQLNEVGTACRSAKVERDKLRRLCENGVANNPEGEIVNETIDSYQYTTINRGNLMFAKAKTRYRETKGELVAVRQALTKQDEEYMRQKAIANRAQKQIDDLTKKVADLFCLEIRGASLQKFPSFTAESARASLEDAMQILQSVHEQMNKLANET